MMVEYDWEAIHLSNYKILVSNCTTNQIKKNKNYGMQNIISITNINIWKIT